MMFNCSIENGEERYLPIDQALLEEVISKRTPSVSAKDLLVFERIREQLMPKEGARKRRAIGYV